MTKNRILAVSRKVMLSLFAVFITLWIYGFQRYFVLNYHEQAQLFRFSSFYFYSYINRPGGLSEYIGSFLTQFYFFHLAGSMIIAGITVVVFKLFYGICKKYDDIELFLIIPFIPAILLFMSFMNINFNISYAVGLLFALGGFIFYCSFRPSIRNMIYIPLYTVVYFVAAGNAFLLLALIVIFELFKRKTKYKYLYLLMALSWSVLLPWLVWWKFYTLPLADAFFSLTFIQILFPAWYHQMLWLSIPILFLFCCFAAKRRRQWRMATWKHLLLNCLTIVASLFFGVRSVYDRKAETLYRMESEVQQNNWEITIMLSNTYPGTNRLVSYYTNIALALTGQLPNRMFHYKQVGPVGLFFDNEMTYFTLGEIYYQLGMFVEAEHCAFESLVVSPKEPGARTLHRLTLINIARRDSAAAIKYINFFKQSFAYREWAQQQRKNLSYAMTDSLFSIPDMPVLSRFNDFFLDYYFPDRALLAILKANPQHKMAFECIMAYYMLQKDFEKIKWCMDTFYENFHYPIMPEHYEEAMLVYHAVVQAGEDFFIQYPVGASTREKFAHYNQTFNMAQTNIRYLEHLEKQFGNTYWYYLHFVKPVLLQKNDEKNRY